MNNSLLAVACMYARTIHEAKTVVLHVYDA